MPTNDRGKSVSEQRQASRSISRRNWLQAAGATGAALLAGCSGNGGNNGGTTVGSTDQLTTIEYWRWPQQAERQNTAEDELVREFNEGPGAEKNIKVEQVKNPFPDHMQALKTAIGGNDAPALAWTTPPSMYPASGKTRSQIEENAPYAYIEDYLDDDVKENIYQYHWNQQQTNYKGLIGVPFFGSIFPSVLYVNTDVWDAAGLGERPKDGWSYEEYHNAIESMHGMTVNGTEVTGLGAGFKDIKSGWPEMTYQYSGTAGDVLHAGYQNSDDEWTLSVASDPVVEGWNGMWGTPIENGWVGNSRAYTNSEMPSNFASGSLGLLPHSTFSRIRFASADVNYDVLPLPTKNGEKNYPAYGTMTRIAILFQALSQDVGGTPEAAMEFINWRNSAENHFKFFNKCSQIVPNKGAYQMAQEQEVSDFVKETQGVQMMSRMDEVLRNHSVVSQEIQNRYSNVKVENGSPVTSFPTAVGSGRLNEEVGSVFERLVMNGNENPEEAFTNAEEAWASVLSNNDITVNEASIGYNSPEPQPGPLPTNSGSSE